MAKRGLAVGLLGIVALLLAGCAKKLPTYRYRLTVEVDTPTGLKTGSSVIEVTSYDQGKGFPGPEAGGVRSKARGEAVAVEIAPGQVLFALLRSAEGDRDYPTRVAFDALRLAPRNADTKGNIEALKLSTRPTILSRQTYPMLVRFQDYRKPRTVQKVDPNQISTSFGRGVRFRSITIQITQDDVIDQIESRLDWLGTSTMGYLDGQFTGGGPALSSILDISDFKRGD